MSPSRKRVSDHGDGRQASVKRKSYVESSKVFVVFKSLLVFSWPFTFSSRKPSDNVHTSALHMEKSS